MLTIYADSRIPDVESLLRPPNFSFVYNEILILLLSCPCPLVVCSASRAKIALRPHKLDMDNDNAKLGAQEVHPKLSTEAVGPELDEKTEARSISDASQLQSRDAATESSTERIDVEKAEPDSQRPGPVKVPRSQRRGLFGRFAILAEVEEPKNYSSTTKWYITTVVALAGIAAPVGSAIIFRMNLDSIPAAPLLTILSCPRRDFS